MIKSYLGSYALLHQSTCLYPNPDKPEQKRSHAKPQQGHRRRRKENLQSMGNPKKAIKNNW